MGLRYTDCLPHVLGLSLRGAVKTSAVWAATLAGDPALTLLCPQSRNQLLRRLSSEEEMGQAGRGDGEMTPYA